jgi:hypothetical protein
MQRANPQRLDNALIEAVFAAAAISVIAAALRFALWEKYEENDIATPRSLKLLLVCTPIAMGLVISMLGPT